MSFYLHNSKNSRTFAPAFEKGTESVAQQVEHIPFKDGVLGSSPSWFTRESFGSLFFVFCVETSSRPPSLMVNLH